LLASQSLLELASAPRLGSLRVASLLARTAHCFLGGSFESALHSFDFNFLTRAVLRNFAARMR